VAIDGKIGCFFLGFSSARFNRLACEQENHITARPTGYQTYKLEQHRQKGSRKEERTHQQ